MRRTYQPRDRDKKEKKLRKDKGRDKRIQKTKKIT